MGMFVRDASKAAAVPWNAPWTLSGSRRSCFALFTASMGFDPDRVESYFHCIVGDSRTPFGLIRLESPVDPKAVLKPMQLEPDPKTINKLTLHQIKANPFVAGAANTFAARSLLADLFEQVPGTTAAKDSKGDKPLGICVYDTQTMGELADVGDVLK